MTFNRTGDPPHRRAAPATIETVMSTSIADDRAIVAAWAALRAKSEALTGARLRDEEMDRLCAELERLQTVISRTPAATAAGLAIKLRCVLEAMVDERTAHAAALNGGMPDAKHLSNAAIAEQILWHLLEQVEAV